MNKDRLIVYLVLLFGTSACSTFYDERREAATAQVATNFEKTGTDGYFAALRGSYAALEIKERAALQHRSTSIRNLDVVTVLAPVPLTPGEHLLASAPAPGGTSYLRTLVADRLVELTGCVQSKTCQRTSTGLTASVAKLLEWRAIPAKRPDALRRVDAAQADVTRQAAAAGDASQPEVTPIATTCQGPVFVTDLASARIELGRAQACLVGQTSVFVGSQGKIDNLLAAIVRAGARHDAALQQAQEIKARIVELNKTPSADPQLLDKIASVKNALGDAATPGVAKALGLEKLGNILQDLLAVELAEASGDVPVASGSEPSEFTRRVQSLLQVLGAAQDVAAAFKAVDPADRASALLIAIAAQRQALDMANLAAQHEDGMRRLGQRELEATLVELSHLARSELAIDALGPRNSSAGSAGLRTADRTWLRAALIAYGGSFTEGRFPTQQIDQARKEGNRAYRLNVAQHTADNRHALLAPAVAQIKAAGKTGLKPDLVAAILGQFGVGLAVLED